ncbi:unnamed protein product [Prunus armeniaca]|uniref:Uncharacterized protein n=1 Tax=Prunus armeniaca TaxID=36596 RepID=A0A6J5Y058_PRUAR|nr:unnamed protein product [Prunus armeniaca]
MVKPVVPADATHHPIQDMTTECMTTISLMSEEDLELTDNWGWTALAVAANRGNLKMVECMVRKSKKILSSAWELIHRCPELVFTKGYNGEFPMEGLCLLHFPSGTTSYSGKMDL